MVSGSDDVASDSASYVEVAVFVDCAGSADEADCRSESCITDGYWLFSDEMDGDASCGDWY